MWWMIPAVSAAWLMGRPSTPLPPPPTTALWKPALWTLGATTTAYVGLAAMEGLHNRLTDGSYARTLRERKREHALHPRSPRSLVNGGSLSLTVVGLNLAVYYYGQHYPRNYLKLADCHQMDWKRNWTLLTAAFCHTNLKHLCANMTSLVPEIPHLLQACGQSPYQFVAFYGSAAIFSSYAQRIVSYNRWTHSWTSFFEFTAPRGMGASGVAMAVFAASCLSQPWNSPSFLVSAWGLGYQVSNDIMGLFYSNEMIGFAVSSLEFHCRTELNHLVRLI